MEILDMITGLNAAILTRVPPEYHAEVATMQAAITQAYESTLHSAEARGFAKGIETAEQCEEVNHVSGFEAGYCHGLAEAIGHVGSPAHRLDEEEGVQPS